jgi:hypothetical protein
MRRSLSLFRRNQPSLRVASGSKYIETGQTGRVELEELHVFQRQSCSHDAHLVGGRVCALRWSGRGVENVARAGSRQRPGRGIA